MVPLAGAKGFTLMQCVIDFASSCREGSWDCLLFGARFLGLLRRLSCFVSAGTLKIHFVEREDVMVPKESGGPGFCL